MIELETPVLSLTEVLAKVVATETMSWLFSVDVPDDEDSVCVVDVLVPAIEFPVAEPVVVLVDVDELLAVKSKYAKVSLNVEDDELLLVDEKSPVRWSPVVVTVESEVLVA